MAQQHWGEDAMTEFALEQLIESSAPRKIKKPIINDTMPPLEPPASSKAGTAVPRNAGTAVPCNPANNKIPQNKIELINPKPVSTTTMIPTVVSKNINNTSNNNNNSNNNPRGLEGAQPLLSIDQQLNRLIEKNNQSLAPEVEKTKPSFVTKSIDENIEELWQKEEIPEAILNKSLPNIDKKDDAKAYFRRVFQSRYELLSASKLEAKYNIKKRMKLKMTTELLTNTLKIKYKHLFAEFNVYKDIYSIIETAVSYHLYLNDPEKTIAQAVKQLLSDPEIQMKQQLIEIVKTFCKFWLKGLIEAELKKYINHQLYVVKNIDEINSIRDAKCLDLIATYAAAIFNITTENEERLKEGKKLLKNKDRSGFTFAVEHLPNNVRDPFQDRDNIAGEMPPDDFNPDEIYKTRNQILNNIDPKQEDRDRHPMTYTVSSEENKESAIQKSKDYIKDLLSETIIPYNLANNAGTAVPCNPANNDKGDWKGRSPSHSDFQEYIENEDEEKFKVLKIERWKLLQKIHDPRRMRIYFYSNEKAYLYMMGVWPCVEARPTWPGDSKIQSGHYCESCQESKFETDIIGNYDQWKKEKQLLRNHKLAPYRKMIIIIKSPDTSHLRVGWEEQLLNMVSHWEQDSLFQTVHVESFLHAILWYHVKMLTLLKRNQLHVEHKMNGISIGNGNLNSTDIKIGRNIYSKPSDNRGNQTDFAMILSVIQGFHEKCADYFYGRFGTFSSMVDELNHLDTMEQRRDVLIQLDGISKTTALKIINKFCKPIIDSDMGIVEIETIDEKNLRTQIMNRMHKKDTFKYEKLYPNSSSINNSTKKMKKKDIETEKEIKIKKDLKGPSLPAMKKKKRARDEDEDLKIHSNSNKSKKSFVSDIMSSDENSEFESEKTKKLKMKSKNESDSDIEETEINYNTYS